MSSSLPPIQAFTDISVVKVARLSETETQQRISRFLQEDHASSLGKDITHRLQTLMESLLPGPGSSMDGTPGR